MPGLISRVKKFGIDGSAYVNPKHVVLVGDQRDRRC